MLISKILPKILNYNTFILLLYCFPMSYLQAQVRVDGNIQTSKRFEVKEKSSLSLHLIDQYQHYLSEIKNSKCPMYPSCSNYGLTVFKNYPFWKAMLLTADRMIRCSHDHKYYPATFEYNKLSWIDLPANLTLTPNLIAGYSSRVYTDAFKLREGADSTLLFINLLINKGLYENALTEIYRKHFQEQNVSPIYYEKELLCYDGLDKELEGINHYYSFPASIQRQPKISFRIAKIYYNCLNFKEAAKKLKEVISNTEDSILLHKSHTLQSLILFREDRTELAKKELIKAKKYTNSTIEINKSQAILNDYSHLKKKSPTKAALLSIIPGLGYLYSGHKGSAITSFVINSLLGYATYTSLKSNNYGTAILTGFLSLTFYIGNLKGAAKSAQRYNQYQKRRIVNKLSEINKINIY